MAVVIARVLRRRIRSDSGAELIELAFVLPILLIVAAGIIDFGFLFWRFETVTNAAREGARLAVLPNYTDADVQARVTQYLQSSGLNPPEHPPVVTRSTLTLVSTGATVDVVKVEVQYPAEFLYLGPFVGLVGGSHSGGMVLRGSSVMRIENAAVSGS